MKLSLQELCFIHRALRGHPVDYSKCGGLALQRSGHSSPVQTAIDHNGLQDAAVIEWLSQSLSGLEVLDNKRITEDGAEAIALSYIFSKNGWVVKRRLQQGESADWLLVNGTRALALEVSGTISGDAVTRLNEKRKQVANCTLPVDLLAIVIAFEIPSILAGSP